MRRVVLDLTGAALASTKDGTALNLDSVRDIVEWECVLTTHASSGLTTVTLGAVSRRVESASWAQMLSTPVTTSTAALTTVITVSAGTTQELRLVTTAHRLIRHSTMRAVFVGSPHATDHLVVTAKWR